MSSQSERVSRVAVRFSTRIIPFNCHWFSADRWFGSWQGGSQRRHPQPPGQVMPNRRLPVRRRRRQELGLLTGVGGASGRSAVTSLPEQCPVTQTHAAHRAGDFLDWRLRDRPACGHGHTGSGHAAVTPSRTLDSGEVDRHPEVTNTNAAHSGGNGSSVRVPPKCPVAPARPRSVAPGPSPPLRPGEPRGNHNAAPA